MTNEEWEDYEADLKRQAELPYQREAIDWNAIAGKLVGLIPTLIAICLALSVLS